jgi:hypothetical protein
MLCAAHRARTSAKPTRSLRCTGAPFNLARIPAHTQAVRAPIDSRAVHRCVTRTRVKLTDRLPATTTAGWYRARLWQLRVQGISAGARCCARRAVCCWQQPACRSRRLARPARPRRRLALLRRAELQPLVVAKSNYRRMSRCPTCPAPTCRALPMAYWLRAISVTRPTSSSPCPSRPARVVKSTH